MPNKRLIISLIMVLGGLYACSSDKPKEPRSPWPEILSQVQVALSDNEPDSIKFARIKTIFKEHQVTIADYRDFYQRDVVDHPEESQGILREIESLIAKEMRRASDENRQKRLKSGANRQRPDHADSLPVEKGKDGERPAR